MVCNQVIYGKLTGDFVDADGNGVQIKDQPIISYFKRSGFKPVADFIDTLNKQKKVMQKCIANFSTQKNKKGSVTYWTPSVSLAKYHGDKGRRQGLDADVWGYSEGSQ